jgi:catalase
VGVMELNRNPENFFAEVEQAAFNPASQALFENTARSVGGAPREIQLRHIGNCLKADPAYGAGVAKALDISLSEIPK